LSRTINYWHLPEYIQYPLLILLIALIISFVACLYLGKRKYLPILALALLIFDIPILVNFWEFYDYSGTKELFWLITTHFPGWVGFIALVLVFIEVVLFIEARINKRSFFYDEKNLYNGQGKNRR
jgi:hypothetical protein